MGFFRPTRAEIDLGALKHNFEVVTKRLPKGVGVLAMVKADAYGHGAVQSARLLEKCGVTAFGVATVEEGLELRESSITSPIIVMGGLMGMGSPASGMMIGADLTPVVHSLETLDFLDAVARAAEKRVDIHLKIDTGMSRLGILPAAIPKFIERLNELPQLKLVGVMTHLADADDAEYTAMQTREFDAVVRQIRAAFGKEVICHIANSIAVVNGKPVVPEAGAPSWVRPGIMLYGAPPTMKSGVNVDIRPVMTLKSGLAMLKTVPAGTKVSYSRTFETKRQTKLGIIPIGYADGYPWALSNKASVLIHCKRAPVVGRVTMDMIIVDVTDIEEARVGSEVVLMGRQGAEEITAQELAGLAQTIHYEIFCGISKRMPRVYIGS